MQQITSNYLSMVHTMLAVMNNEKEAWAGESHIAEEIAAIEVEYNDAYAIINELASINTKATNEVARDELGNILRLVLKLCNRICVYAKRNNDKAILALVDHSINSLSKGMRADVLGRCSAIINGAESKLDVLQNYKVTSADIDTIRKSLAAYEASSSSHSVISTNKQILNQDINTILNSLHQRVDILDNLVEGFIDDEELIAQYKTSRLVHHYGKGKTLKNKTNESTTPVK